MPLYQFVLFGWLKLVGFSLVSVRSLHYLLVGLAAIVAWDAVRRLGLIRKPSHRLVFCLLVLLSSASIYAYRMARPESSVCCCWPRRFGHFSIRRASASVISRRAFRSAAGFAPGCRWVPYLFLLCAIFWWLGVRRFRPESIALCLGSVAALGVLFVFYSSHGVWDDFVRSIRLHTVANQGLHVDIIEGYGPGFKEKISSIPSRYMDYSLAALLLAGALMGWQFWRARLLRKSSPLVFGLCAALIVPVTLHLTAVFNLYYSWLAFMPLALGICAELERQLSLPASRLGRLAVTTLLALACLIGLLLLIAVTHF